MRSRAAAALLGSKGFGSLFDMEGGISAWQGLTAAGSPEAGMSFFPDMAGPAELIALAWVLEEGTRKFYAALAGLPAGRSAGTLFADLVSAEEHHKAALLGLYRKTANAEPGPAFPKDVIAADDDRMEGGVRLADALAWAKDREGRDLLELSMALETDSYDLYIKMGRRVTDAQAKAVFGRLAEEEKEHLKRMAALLDGLL